ncbi:hypothetical protein TNCV_4520611 [Trichonephila clavipes]|nr:hypothetical protein TNCV_4520611 [Trichonephila clavipes]
MIRYLDHLATATPTNVEKCSTNFYEEPSVHIWLYTRKLSTSGIFNVATVTKWTWSHTLGLHVKISNLSAIEDPPCREPDARSNPCWCSVEVRRGDTTSGVIVVI